MPKTKKPAAVDAPCADYTAATNRSPAIQNAQPEQLPGTAAAASFTPQASFPDSKTEFRLLVESKWRTGEYTCPDGYDMFLLDTVAILSPKKATDPKEQQIQQLNYENFINVMAEMIQKYTPKIQKLQEESK